MADPNLDSVHEGANSNSEHSLRESENNSGTANQVNLF